MLLSHQGGGGEDNNSVPLATISSEGNVMQAEKTHFHHLLYVFLDDRRVGVGLHRHSPLVDHGGLGVGRAGGAGVLL